MKARSYFRLGSFNIFDHIVTVSCVKREVCVIILNRFSLISPSIFHLYHNVNHFGCPRCKPSLVGAHCNTASILLYSCIILYHHPFMISLNKIQVGIHSTLFTINLIYNFYLNLHKKSCCPQNGTAEEKTCPDGLRFNPNLNFNVYPCQYPNEVACLERSALREFLYFHYILIRYSGDMSRTAAA